MHILAWFKQTVCFLLLFISTISYATLIELPQNTNTLLPAEKAFQIDAFLNREAIQIDFQITNQCCYLYQKRLQIQTSPTSIQLNLPTLPAGQIKSDEFEGETIVYDTDFSLSIPRPPIDKPFDLTIQYQGCAKSGFCYPPMEKLFHIENDQITPVQALSAIPPTPVVSEPLSKHLSVWSLIQYLSMGILLAFTPCVLPMIPILMGILLGGKTTGTGRAFRIASIYVLFMSCTYAGMGILAAQLGYTLQGTLQTPLVVGLFALLLILMAFWLFEWIDFRGLNFLYNRISPTLNQAASHNIYLSAAVMGILATLIASPCLTAPLLGVITYIMQTQDKLYGGIALFTMGLGLGIPLLLVAILGPKILPKRGAWMIWISRGFGIVLIALAMQMVLRVWTPITPTSSQITISTQKQLDQLRLEAMQHHRPLLIDFYADWCLSCRHIDHILAMPAMQQKLSLWTVIRADITQQNAETRQLMQTYGVIAPPVLLLYDAEGQPINTLVGEISQAQLEEALNRADQGR